MCLGEGGVSNTIQCSNYLPQRSRCCVGLLLKIRILCQRLRKVNHTVKRPKFEILFGENIFFSKILLVTPP
jgi:hypothetical protein